VRLAVPFPDFGKIRADAQYIVLPEPWVGVSRAFLRALLFIALSLALLGAIAWLEPRFFRK
jgi:hypothetical protein